MKLDEVNAKILYDLLIDGRKSFKDIAQECNTSKDVIAKRYKQMRIKGVITGATVENSSGCYGCSFVAAIEVKAQCQKEKEIISQLKKIPQVFGFYTIGVVPGFVAPVLLRSIDELDTIKQSIKKIRYVLDAESVMWTGIHNAPENLSILQGALRSKLTNAKATVKKPGSKFDDIDTQIIERLVANGRMPFTKISDELDVSTDTVIRRYEHLKQSGDLRVVIQLDPVKIGYFARAVFKLSFAATETSVDKARELADIPDVVLIHKTSGRFDFVILVMVKDIKQLLAVQKRITDMPCLTYMELHVEELSGPWPHAREFISTF